MATQLVEIMVNRLKTKTLKLLTIIDFADRLRADTCQTAA